MVRARTWTVEITIRENADEGATLEAGDEAAAAQALAELATRLLEVTTGDIEPVSRRHMRMLV